MPGDALHKSEAERGGERCVPEAHHLQQPGLLRSFGYAGAGLWWVLRTQRNARLHVVVALCVIALGVWLRLDVVRWAILTLTIGSVLVGETVNTVVEALVDLVCPEIHPRAKVAKDVAAAGVLLLSGVAVIVGLLILGPPLYTRLRF